MWETVPKTADRAEDVDECAGQRSEDGCTADVAFRIPHPACRNRCGLDSEIAEQGDGRGGADRAQR